MNGDFAFDKNTCKLAAISMTSYFELPPKPQGESAIPIPAQTLALDFGA
ncbi:MAG: hypothetical protein LBK99_19600 [Opitutaceae bacterium]|jgi:hypothetical protein|nr:hypothetical protein [Opitutaceae bacterium]